MDIRTPGLDGLEATRRLIDPAQPGFAPRIVILTTTVKTHVAGILGKLGVRNRAQAVVLAYESGLIRAGVGSSATPGWTSPDS